MATASVETEIAAAREPIAVRSSQNSVSKPQTTHTATPAPRPTVAGSDGWDFPSLNFGGLQTLLKLRHRRQIKPRLSADFGLDFDPATSKAKPLFALNYQLKEDNKDFGTLRLTHRRAVLVKNFNVNLEKAKLPVTFRLNTAAGLTYEGKPDFDINVGDLRPKWLVGVAAVTLLALRQPLTGSRFFGDHIFANDHVTATTKFEAKARAQRKGDGLQLSLGQLNAVIEI